MMFAQTIASEWLVPVRHELFLFAGTFFLLGALDEFAVDIIYIWLRLSGRVRTRRVDESQMLAAPLPAKCAVFIPAWREAEVIAATISHALASWPQIDVRLYVGCYRNDPETQRAVVEGARGDQRLHLVIHDNDGPTCKADCLNRLYRALRNDEERKGFRVKAVILHDAEDMVDPLGLPLLLSAMDEVEFAQLPVLALPQRRSPLVAGHYSDEFAEAHAKSMVVRSALGQGIPGAGVGCAIDHALLDRIARERGGEGPFATGSLTEDYELGLQSAAMGSRSLFLRVRTTDGRLIGTRAYFPSSMNAAIRQKTRWIHGIAFQGWDRLGWRGGPAALWMQLRDRRGPMAAFLLALAYLLVLLSGLELLLTRLGLISLPPLSPVVHWLLLANLVAFTWRLAARMAFTAREYGWRQGMLALPRAIVSNTVAIVSAPRALFAYVRSLRGTATPWDKTDHHSHPVLGETLLLGSGAR